MTKPYVPTEFQIQRTKEKRLKCSKAGSTATPAFGRRADFVEGFRARPGLAAPYRKSKAGGVRVGFTAGTLIHRPSEVVSWMIRRAMMPHRPIPAVTIYDAEGKAVATYDPNTRTRTPIAAAVAQGESVSVPRTRPRVQVPPAAPREKR